MGVQVEATYGATKKFVAAGRGNVQRRLYESVYLFPTLRIHGELRH